MIPSAPSRPPYRSGWFAALVAHGNGGVRQAFLLYRFKNTLTSDDILIISPNRMFADYISNVLPELGEEKVNETSMEAVADDLLDGQYRFQTFFEQTAALLEKNDEAMKRRLEYKASHDFLKQLDR